MVEKKKQGRDSPDLSNSSIDDIDNVLQGSTKNLKKLKFAAPRFSPNEVDPYDDGLPRKAPIGYETELNTSRQAI